MQFTHQSCQVNEGAVQVRIAFGYKGHITTLLQRTPAGFDGFAPLPFKHNRVMVIRKDQAEHLFLFRVNIQFTISWAYDLPPLRFFGYTTTGQSRIIRYAFTVISSGSPGPDTPPYSGYLLLPYSCCFPPLSCP